VETNTGAVTRGESRPAGAPRPPLVTRPLLVRFVSTVGAAAFGAGFGVTQNASLTVMYDRVPESGYSAVSALWNLAYDGGMGVGAAGFGVLVVRTGYPAAFALTAAVLPVVLAAAARRPRPSRP